MYLARTHASATHLLATPTNDNTFRRARRRCRTTPTASTRSTTSRASSPRRASRPRPWMATSPPRRARYALPRPASTQSLRPSWHLNDCCACRSAHALQTQSLLAAINRRQHTSCPTSPRSSQFVPRPRHRARSRAQTVRTRPPSATRQNKHPSSDRNRRPPPTSRRVPPMLRAHRHAQVVRPLPASRRAIQRALTALKVQRNARRQATSRALHSLRRLLAAFPRP